MPTRGSLRAALWVARLRRLYGRLSPYAGAFGIFAGFLSYLNAIEEVVGEAINALLLTITLYEIEVPKRALGLQTTGRRGALVAVAGLASYLSFRFVAPPYGLYLSLVVLIPAYLGLTRVLTADISWTSPPAKIAKAYGDALSVADREDPGFADRDVILFWGLRRIRSIALFRTGFSAYRLLPYYVGVLAATTFLAIIDSILPASFLIGVALIGLAATRVRAKKAARQPSRSRRGLRRRLLVATKALRQYDRDDLTRVARMVRAFVHPRAMFYFLLSIWATVFALATLVVLVTVAGILAVAFLFLPLALILIALAPPSLILPYYAWKLLFSLGRKDKVSMLGAPSFFLGASGATVLAMTAPAWAQVQVPSPTPLLGPSVSATFIVMVGLGFAQLGALATLRRRRGRSYLNRRDENRAAVLLLVTVVGLLWWADSGAFRENVLILALSSYFWYATMTFARPALVPKGDEERRKRSYWIASAFLLTAAYTAYEGETFFMTLCLVGVGAAALYGMSKKRQRTFGWYLLGIKDVPRPEADTPP